MSPLWTPPVDRASNDVITATIWNQMMGANGNMAHAQAISKYKTAAQSFIATTTYADVTATTGTFSFAIAANEEWLFEAWLGLSAVGAGGAKFQLTGPASPTHVFGGHLSNVLIESGAQPYGVTINWVVAAAFGTIMQASGSAATGSLFTGSGVYLFAHIKNGANAGTVALQGAQFTASGTTTISGTGATMRAQRLISA